MEVRTISGVLFAADGSLWNGSCEVSWPRFQTVGGEEVAMGSGWWKVRQGRLTVRLVANEGAVPACRYRAVFRSATGTLYGVEDWIVPAGVGNVMLEEVRVPEVSTT